MTNNGHDSSTGLGLRLGYQGQLGSQVTVGAAYSPRINMSRFDDYRGLFAGNGDFDIPENINLGAAWQASPALLLALDYQRINYSGVASVGGSSTMSWSQPTPRRRSAMARRRTSPTRSWRAMAMFTAPGWRFRSARRWS